MVWLRKDLNLHYASSLQMCHRHHPEASARLRMNFLKWAQLLYCLWLVIFFFAAIITNSISMKCAMRITTSCKPALCEWCAVLHLSVQAAPWVVSNEWWEIFPRVQCCFAGKSHRGSDDDMSCSYVKKFRDSRLLTMLTRAHARTHQTPSTCSFA